MPATEELAAFIRDQFRSVWTLEVLLFLKQHAPSPWDKHALVEALRASDGIILKSLETLSAGGLIICDDVGRAQYAPANGELGELVDATQELYARKPDAVRRLIVASSSSDLSAFADSFRLRKD